MSAEVSRFRCKIKYISAAHKACAQRLDRTSFEQRRREERAARGGRQMLIAVAGCVAQAEGKEIVRRAGAVDLVVGSQNYHRLPDMVARARNGEKVIDTDFPVEDKFDALEIG